jgi:putative transposase
MEYKRTIKIPIHYLTTIEKINKLNKLTARFTYAVRLFSDIISKTKKDTRKDLVKYEKQIAKKTKLSSGYIQQCKDKAIWNWKSYKKEHSSWERKLKASKQGTKWHNKLKKREPKKPFSNSRNRIPIRLDYRTISIKTNIQLNGNLIKQLKEETNITNSWANISTIEKRNKIMIPLNPAKYHIKKLQSASNISDAEIIKKKNKYYVYITCSYNIPFQPIQSVRAIDLGIIRLVTAVLITPNNSLSKNSFLTMKESKTKDRINRHNSLIAKLQRLQKWTALRRARQRRQNFIEDRERKIAEEITEQSENCLVAIGNPKRLKYRSYKGNGKRSLRKKLQQWRYRKLSNCIIQSCEEKGIYAITTSEAGSSTACSKCSSNDIARPYQNNWSLFKCMNCRIILNADVNAAVNIGRRLLEKQALFHQWASDEHARTADDCLYPGMSAETHNEALSVDAQGFNPE